MKAQEQGVARVEQDYDALYEHAMHIIDRSRRLTKMMMEEGFITDPPSPHG